MEVTSEVSLIPALRTTDSSSIPVTINLFPHSAGNEFISSVQLLNAGKGCWMKSTSLCKETEVLTCTLLMTAV